MLGEVVLIADENHARGTWPLARVVEVMMSDILVRANKVKTTPKVATRSKKEARESGAFYKYLTRPIVKLCLLEMDKEDETRDS